MDKELFNQKTVEKLSSEIKLTAVQKKAAKEWLYYLDEGKLKKEKLNYLKFVEIVLKDLLGYEIKEIDFEEGNIEFSYKNKEGKTILGIEAKGTKTKSLDDEQKGYKEGQESAIIQLWTYMGNLDLEYGIATNYKHFVLIDKKKSSSRHFLNFEEVRNNENKLKEFVAIFSKEQIIDNGFIEKLEEASAIEERKFTKEFYKLFHETRLMLVKEFQENGVSKEESVHHAQLFLNRLMFVFFAEDTDKLQTRLFEDLVISALNTEMIISEHSSLVSTMILNFFLSLDKGSETPRKIFGFNGGLFREEIPKRIYFKDFKDKKFFNDIYLYSELKKEPELDPISKPIFQRYLNKLNPIIKNLLVMASFDFKTEVSVNILGHIFEQSLSDLEELKEDTPQKRKKEGIFYTPEYIAEYICRNTIISYLSNKKATTPRGLILEYADNIKELENKFSYFKILDPACGSGAFLIKAVEILLEIHKEIQIFKQDKGQYTAVKRGKKKQDGEQLMLLKWNEEDEARTIIENNIYGVDLNEESVEITKLSLFLKIAKKNRKLLDLSKNIKVGNSLVEDKEVHKRAFKWESEFKEVFDGGGFDIVIGNPPYIFARESKFTEEEKKYYYANYKLQQYQINTYILFTELGHKLLKKNGLLGFIIPNNWQTIDTCYKFRELIFSQTSGIKIVNSYDKIFEDANVDNGILIFEKEPKWNYELIELKNKEFNVISKGKKFEGNNYIINFTSLKNSEIQPFLDKINKVSIKLDELSILKSGLKAYEVGKGTPPQTKEMKNDRIYHTREKKDNTFYKYLEGKDVSRYFLGWSGQYLKYGKNLAAPRFFELFSSQRILVRQIPAQPPYCIHAIYTEEVYINDINSMVIFDFKENYSPKFILGVINSKLTSFWFINTFDKLQRGLFPQFKVKELATFPIFKTKDKNEQKRIIELVDLILKNKRDFNSKREKFLTRIHGTFKIEKLTKKIEEFYKSEFNDLMNEIQKISSHNLNLKEQDEWEDYFNEYKKELERLDHSVSEANNLIDEEVYKLYGLNKEERKIVEESLKQI